MTFLRPATWAEALESRAAHPEAVPVAGGTDVLVALNFDHLHPDGLLDLGGLGEIQAVERDGDQLHLGAGVTYAQMIARLGTDLPALAGAARTVGSPPIRNRGTIGGNLATASPAGDCHPPLLACGAEVELASTAGSRRLPVTEFFTGPKRCALRPDELVQGVWVPASSGPQTFSKVGVRNAMVIAVCSFALALHPRTRRVGTGIGSAGPVPLVARDAEEFLQGHLAETGEWESRRPLTESVMEHFADLVAGAARPIDDVRGSAAYRRHALGVLARRSLAWCWNDYRESGT